LFSITGTNFFSTGNFFECIRLGVEIGLLALALTPVIVTGGIDLSVGSMMGLCAVSLGGCGAMRACRWAWRCCSRSRSVAGRSFDGLLIARLKVSPLIVTLALTRCFAGLPRASRWAQELFGFPNDSCFSAKVLGRRCSYANGLSWW